MNGYWGARVLFLSKRGTGKGWRWCVFVCLRWGVCVCVCVWMGYFGVYHIQRLTNLLFSQDLYKKKQNDDSS